MKSLKSMTMAEVAAYVQSALSKEGIISTLSGGSCVTYWAGNDFISDDIDLIADGIVSRKKIRAVMMEIGFREFNRYFVHDDTKWFIEFPNGPLSVGEERPKHISLVRLTTGELRLLSSTDCVKDRLAGWFYYHDQQCLKQAIAVAKSCAIDLEELKRWAKKEKQLTAFNEFSSQLSIQ